jgi:hypothetical protein
MNCAMNNMISHDDFTNNSNYSKKKAEGTVGALLVKDSNLQFNIFLAAELP